MRLRLVSLVALAASAVVLAGCTSAPSAAPSPPASASPSPTSTPTPEVDPLIVVTLDGVTFTDEAGVTEAAYDDPTALLGLLEEITGVLPEPEAVEGMEGYETTLETYTWDGLRVTADSTGEGPAWIAVTGADLDGVAIETEEGLHVGSTRDDLVAADAWALVDTEDTATASYLGLGGREVPDTQSLTHPGSVGIEFLLFALDGDVVSQMTVPSNDFSDL